MRLEVRDLFYSGQISSVNGCTRDELRRLSRPFPGSADLGPACNVDAFEGKNQDGVLLADYIAGLPSPGILHNVGVQLGVGVLF